MPKRKSIHSLVGIYIYIHISINKKQQLFTFLFLLILLRFGASPLIKFLIKI